MISAYINTRQCLILFQTILFVVGFLQPAVNANFPEKENGGVQDKKTERRARARPRARKRDEKGTGKKEGWRDVAANSFPPPLPQKPAAHFGQ